MALDKDDETTSRLISALIAAEPALTALLHEHLAANDELLPHVFIGDVTRWLTANGPQPHVLGVLDEAVVSDSMYVQGLVYISFLENLEPGAPSDDRIVASLPPRLRAAFTVVHGETR
jgi:hypothetical protein